MAVVANAWYARRSMAPDDLRNIALIAHVDHGKTTVVEQLLRLASCSPQDPGLSDQDQPIADAPLFPVVRISYGSHALNLIDMPSHGDLGAAVERSIQLADGAMLIVDASEGPLPHTRFPLRKAIERGLPVVVVVNKVDRPDAQPDRVVSEVQKLLESLEASPKQVAFPVVYTVARHGLAARVPDVHGTTFNTLLATLIEHIPPPSDDVQGAVTLWAHHRVHDETHGTLAIGRVLGGALRSDVTMNLFGSSARTGVSPTMLMQFDGRGYQVRDAVARGDIVAVAGLGSPNEGDVLTTMDHRPSSAIRAEEPTLMLTLGVNHSPMAGRSKSSHFLTARHLEQRLVEATRRNGGIRCEPADDGSSFRLFVRGELLLATLVESMRREGYEMELGRPEIVTRDVEGRLLEPNELVVVDSLDSDVVVVTQRMHARGARLMRMSDPGLGRAHLAFRLRSRAMLGCRQELRQATRGTASVTTLFDGWVPWQGARERRLTGAIVADRDGRTTPYSLFHLQPRGVLFEGPGATVYEGMIVGEHNGGADIRVNVTKEPKVADVRSHNREQHVLLLPAVPWTPCSALLWIESDELVEVTPESVRVRKRGG